MKKVILLSCIIIIILVVPLTIALIYKDSLEVHNYRINKVECSDNYLRILVKSETTKNLLLLFKVYSDKGNINIYTNQKLNKFNSDYFLVNTNLKCNSLLKVEVNGYADIKLKNKDSERIIYINYNPGYQFNYKENKIPSSLLPIIETQVTNEYASYAYLGSKLIYSKNSRNEELYYIQDSLNSNSIVANGNGNLISLQDYEPYGNNIELSPYTDTRFKFTNKELDKDSDLYYFGARYYDSGIGRFITNDRVFNPSNSPYAYANNNPIRYIDPDGNDPMYVNIGEASQNLKDQASLFLENNLGRIYKNLAVKYGLQQSDSVSVSLSKIPIRKLPKYTEYLHKSLGKEKLDSERLETDIMNLLLPQFLRDGFNSESPEDLPDDKGLQSDEDNRIGNKQFVLVGEASYYGRSDRFHGKRTASGEIFDTDTLTAAIQLRYWKQFKGKYARVYSVDDPGKYVDVRINDNGPLKTGRVIDLSEAAFKYLFGSLDRGIGRVKIQLLDVKPKSR